MPITKTAKRALRSSGKKKIVNKIRNSNLEKAIRSAKKSGSAKDVKAATSLADRASKNKIIHKNKAARIKSQLSKLLVKKTDTPKAPKAKKTSKKK